jgi:hypothetical protein
VVTAASVLGVGQAFARPRGAWVAGDYRALPGLTGGFQTLELKSGVQRAAVAVASEDPAELTGLQAATDAAEGRSGVSGDQTGTARSLAAVSWLLRNRPTASWLIAEQPSRGSAYSVADLRALNDAAPQVAFGFEGVSGGYRVGTCGGADPMLAEVGGAWDAMLGEGRRFWVFAGGGSAGGGSASGKLAGTEGEPTADGFSETHAFRVGATSKDAVASLRSGKSYVTQGQIVSRLYFAAEQSGRADDLATMGQTLDAETGSDVVVTVKFFVPESNDRGDQVRVDHVDLIGGTVGGKATPGSARYSLPSNPSSTVAARFDAGDWSRGWERCGWHEARYVIRNVRSDSYLRLRGTNLGLKVAGRTDAQGNPLPDEPTAAGASDPAGSGLWFYSNPIFIHVR